MPKPENMKVTLFDLPVKKGWTFYALFNLRLFFELLNVRFDVVVANDLDTLPATFLAARLKRKKIVYDSHEYFTELPELRYRRFTRKVWLFFEKKMVPKVDRAYTVCGSIASEYKEKYNIPFEVVRNVPIRNTKDIPPPKQYFIWPPNHVILYQGAVNMGRGLELAIQTMAYLDNTTLIILGSGTIIEELKQLVNDLDMQNKVILPGRIDKSYLKYYTRKADLGISLEEDMGLSYRYALPNKLFDYIQAEIPVLVSDLPEMKKIIKTYQVGEVLIGRQPENLAKVFKEMLFDKEKRAVWKTNLGKAAKQLCWENEAQKLEAIFDFKT